MKKLKLTIFFVWLAMLIAYIISAYHGIMIAKMIFVPLAILSLVVALFVVYLVFEFLVDMMPDSIYVLSAVALLLPWLLHYSEFVNTVVYLVISCIIMITMFFSYYIAKKDKYYDICDSLKCIIILFSVTTLIGIFQDKDFYSMISISMLLVSWLQKIILFVKAKIKHKTIGLSTNISERTRSGGVKGWASVSFNSSGTNAYVDYHPGYGWTEEIYTISYKLPNGKVVRERIGLSDDEYLKKYYFITYNGIGTAHEKVRSTLCKDQEKAEKMFESLIPKRIKKKNEREDRKKERRLKSKKTVKHKKTEFEKFEEKYDKANKR